MINRLLKGSFADVADTEIESTAAIPEGIETEYESIVRSQLERGHVSASCCTVEVRRIAKVQDGRSVYLAMIRLTRWERSSALRLLLGLPIFETKVQAALAGSWLGDVSVFGGLWLHPSGQLRHTQAMKELRDLIMQMEGASQPSGSRADTLWSLPPELRE